MFFKIFNVKYFENANHFIKPNMLCGHTLHVVTHHMLCGLLNRLIYFVLDHINGGMLNALIIQKTDQNESQEVFTLQCVRCSIYTSE